ncbi:MAG: Sll0314/Alr1548 family TPR repeat-containing protein [Oscillatoriaceae cyanobacterium]
MVTEFSPQGRRLGALRYLVAVGTTLAAIVLAHPALAGDPFRTTNPHAIGDTTERAFRVLFQEGNYQQSATILKDAAKEEPKEPLVYAMKAAFAYLEEDWDNLDTYASRTRETGEELTKTDALRGNLYTAVGHFLEGAYIISTEGTIRGTPQALNKLQKVFHYLDEAEKISAEDPEVNLIKGFMDLMLAVNLPFADPAEAIKRLRDYAGPDYLAYRGLALGYRDLDQQADALAAVNQALQLTPNNPELFYLKAQILVEKGGDRDLALLQEAQANFDAALAQAPAKFPPGLQRQLQKERDRNARRIQRLTSPS